MKATLLWLLPKNVKNAAPRNPKGTHISQWKYPYFHLLYCTELGHKDARNQNCAIKNKSKEERDEASKYILNEGVESCVILSAKIGKYR